MSHTWMAQRCNVFVFSAGPRQRWRRALRALGSDRAGAVGPTLGLMLPLLVGFAGLGSEVGDWYVTQRTMQGAADSAAYSAATALAAGESAIAFTAEAKSVAGSYGFVDGSNGVTVTVNNPPTTGNHTSDSNAVEVSITRPQPLMLVSLFLSSPPTIQAAAVATPTPTGNSGTGNSSAGNSTGCVLALDRGNVTDMTDTGSTVLNLNSCNLYVNSPNIDALRLTGSAQINANQAYISGNYTMSGHASLNTTVANGIHTGAQPAPDPYANVQIPSYQGCDQTNFSLSGGATRTFTPGSSGQMVFCNGFSLSGGSQVTLSPGIYIINQGSFSLSGNSSITGSGVTIILTSSTGQNYATVSISGGSTVNITAPTAGPIPGLAFFQDRNAPASGSDSFSGGSTQNITGAIYFPNQNLNFSGGTETGGATCTQLIALTFTFTGNSNFNSNCVSTGVTGIGNSLVHLAE